jgi:hypothetical protein
MKKIKIRLHEPEQGGGPTWLNKFKNDENLKTKGHT